MEQQGAAADAAPGQTRNEEAARLGESQGHDQSIGAHGVSKRRKRSRQLRRRAIGEGLWRLLVIY